MYFLRYHFEVNELEVKDSRQADKETDR